MSIELPKKYDHQASENKWQDQWDTDKIFSWDPNRDHADTFKVDTPPPTVSGSLHIGHVFSYTQTDIQVRFQRMTGKNIFYPMGWDDNGLPTERRVQNIYGIQCDPTLPYDPEWRPEKRDIKRDEYTSVSRKNFIDACSIITQEDEKVFESLWRRLGLSVDWALQYETINDHCRHISQQSFIDLFTQNDIYSTESPTMWDVDFKTAVAQAELEDREKPGAYHHIRFDIEDGGTFDIATTRPELLISCIAVVAHPDDERYQPYFGKHAITPLFGARVPILPAAHADPEKGTGILMVCTFGDVMDVEFWKQSDLPIKQSIGKNGRLLPIEIGTAPFESNTIEKSQQNYDQLKGLRVKKARQKIRELLTATGALIGEIEEITHPVKFYEKGDSPIEFIPTRQWFTKLLDHKDDLIKQGKKIKWHPHFMQIRYENWVAGLNQDWCMSRQRFFGVPFPVWHPLDAVGNPRYDAPIISTSDQLPVDPLTDAPKGYTESQRHQANGFIGDPNVMDTWATSSLTPQLMTHWGIDEARHKKLFPMDIRPQSHEIIRTWAFYTIVKAWLHEKSIPWHHVVISGWILDPDRKKMSKSKGNVVTPDHLLDEYSSDAIRYWSAKARLGADTAFDPSVFTIGKKLVTKLFNASKFVMIQIKDFDKNDTSLITEPLDTAYVKSLKTVIEQSTAHFKVLDYAAALDTIETAFWKFCDHYIELVKTRAYKEENIAKKESALATLSWSLSVFLRLFAPYLPFITEEIWSWRFREQFGSVHISAWPTISEVANVKDESLSLLTQAIDILSHIRTAKTHAQKNMKHPVSQLTITCSESSQKSIILILDDLYRAGSIENHRFESVTSDDIEVEAILSE